MDKCSIILLCISLIGVSICLAGCIANNPASTPLTTTAQSSTYIKITINQANKINSSDLNSISGSDNSFPRLSNKMDYLVLNATIQNTGDNDFPFTLNSFQIIGDSSIGAWHPPIAAVLSQTGVLTDTLNESEVIPAKSSITGVIFFTIVKSVKMCNFSVQDSLGTSVSEVDNINAIPISEVQIPQIPIEHLNITEKAAMKTTPSGYEEVMGMLGQHIVLPSIPNDTFLLTLKTTIQNTGNSNLTFRQNSFSLICNAPIPASHMPWVDLFGGNVAFPLNKTVVFPANSSTDGFFFITNYRNASNCRFTVSDSLGNTVGDLDLASLDTFAAPEAPPTTSSR